MADLLLGDTHECTLIFPSIGALPEQSLEFYVKDDGAISRITQPYFVFAKPPCVDATAIICGTVIRYGLEHSSQLVVGTSKLVGATAPSLEADITYVYIESLPRQYMRDIFRSVIKTGAEYLHTDDEMKSTKRRKT